MPNEEKETVADKQGPPPYTADFAQSLTATIGPTPVDDIVTYPEGGRDGWLVVLGAFCGLTASLGIYNTSGVFSAVIAETILPEVSPSTLGWLFSVYAFVNWFCGVQVGPTFDAMGPRALLIAGTVCTLVGIFSLSVCTGRIGLPEILCALFILITIQSTIRSCCHTPS
jgi:multisubunit Na+/H+ antiporter MnhG subunit